MDRDRDFGSSGRLGRRPKGVADDTLVSTNLGLDQGEPIVAVATCQLRALSGDVPDVSVPLGGRGFGASDGARARWNDHKSIRRALLDRRIMSALS
jgi:hypothetical protein